MCSLEVLKFHKTSSFKGWHTRGAGLDTYSRPCSKIHRHCDAREKKRRRRKKNEGSIVFCPVHNVEDTFARDYHDATACFFPICTDSLIIEKRHRRARKRRRSCRFHSLLAVFCVVLFYAALHYLLARSSFAAATMFVSASLTSFHVRVLSPQSGFTHSLSTGTRAAALRRRVTIASTDGMLGEWMS